MPATPLFVVNGEPIDLQEAIRRSILHEEDFLDNTLVFELLRQYAAKKGISNSDAELQLAADEMRYARGLESLEKLRQWIKAAHQTESSLEKSLDGMLLRNKIRSAISDSEIEAYFTEHRLDFDRVELYSCRIESEGKAQELLAQIRDEGANFHVLTMEHSTDEETRPKAGYVGLLSRSELSSELEPVVFRAQPGAVIGPVKTEKGWNLFKVSAVHKASLERERDRVRLQIFTGLVNELRAQAQVQMPILETAAAAA